jgi:hypothetical protein
MLPHNLVLSKNDHFVTSTETWSQLARFLKLPKETIIWESAYCDGASGESWHELGYTRVIHEEGRDFFKWEPIKYDIQITNPPFSKKMEWMLRSIELDKPFVLIMPASIISTIATRRLFCNRRRPHDLQMIIPTRRINFVYYNEETRKSDPSIYSRSSFDCIFFTYKLNLPSDINFIETPEEIISRRLRKRQRRERDSRLKKRNRMKKKKQKQKEII